jgi:hypothetical protein
MSTLLPTLGDHVCDVVGICADEEMRGTNTVPHVAVVKNMHAVWNWAVRQRPSKPMREYRPSVIGDSAVAFFAYPRRPKPTGIAFCNLCPESNLYRH